MTNPNEQIMQEPALQQNPPAPLPYQATRREKAIIAANLGGAILAVWMLFTVQYTIAFSMSFRFFWMLTICCILMTVCSRRQKKTGRGKTLLYILSSVCVSIIAFMIVSTALAQQPVMYRFRRFSYMSEFDLDNADTLLPEKLPAVHDDYLFHTELQRPEILRGVIRDTRAEIAMLCMHTDDAVIAEYEAKLEALHQTGEPNLKCSEDEVEITEQSCRKYCTDETEFRIAVQRETQSFPNWMYRCILEAGITDDLNHAVLYPNALINKETNLMIIWTNCR